jgi:death on curing protein
MPIYYLTVEDVVATHAKTVELSGGGRLGALDLGQLESVLTHIQNDDLYQEFADKLTHLFFGIAKFHCFQDGNKRTAIAACTHMLLTNGYLYCAASFLRDMENIAVQVADDIISKDLLREIIFAHLEQDTDNEELKLKIFEAISARAPDNDEPRPSD